MRFAALLASPLLLLAASQCRSPDCVEEATCANAGGDAAANDAQRGSDAGDAPTDPCVNNTTDPKCLDEATAFFVSASKGDDGAAGTRAAPLRTVGAVLGKLTVLKKRVYICEGNYSEDVVLTSAHAGASFFGGFDCDWRPKTESSPHFGKTTLALKVEKTTGIALADITFESTDAIASGTSSVGALVITSEVTMKRVSILAGNGVRGDNGTTQMFNYPPNRDGCPGADGGLQLVINCPNGETTTGGKGGGSGFNGDKGLPGAKANGGETPCSGAAVIDGDPASTAAEGDGGVLGLLSELGWKAGDGIAGPHGGNGQGGGGGYGGGGGFGGGGGGGGCGGAGGRGGQGGGGSISLASFSSTVRLEACSLRAKDGSNGGNGSAGQPGQPKGGTPSTAVFPSCGGGLGGAGATGGNGGNGAGGVSIGVLYKDFKPEIDVATLGKITIGQAGAPGTGPGRPGQQLPPTTVYELK